MPCVLETHRSLETSTPISSLTTAAMTGHSIITRYSTVLSNGWTKITVMLMVELRSKDLMTIAKLTSTYLHQSQFTTKMTTESAKKG